MRLLPIVGVLWLLPHHAHACRLAIPPEMLQGRVAEVVLSIQGAAATAASFKPGWTVTITNDPSWQVSVAGHAIVGAAFLAGPEILSMLAFSPAPGLSCETILGGGRQASVSLTFYKDDRLVRTRIGRSHLGLVP